jgi:transcriptional regulator with XRE-family HTH domain
VAARTSPTFRRRRLARRIRELREQAGLTQERAAVGLDMSKSALSRKENGDVATSVHEARSMMDLYDTYDPGLLELAREAREKGWWRAYGIEDKGYVDLETEACTVRELSLLHIPGLLQTEDYVRALLNADRLQRTKRHLKNSVAVRMIRQQRLTDGDHPLGLMAVVDEAALTKPVGGTNVMRTQLRHVVEMARLDSVALRVLSRGDGAHAGMDGGFTLLEFPEPQDQNILYVAYPTGSIHVEKGTEVREATMMFEHLFADALPHEASIELIEQAARDL